MIHIELIHDNERAFSRYNSFDNCDEILTPVYFDLNGKKCFIFNHTTEVSNIRPNGWGRFNIKRSNEDLQNYTSQLETNDGKYFCFHGKRDVWELLTWVKEKGYTFVSDAKLTINNSHYGKFYEFHGNLNEYSCGFMYRIYDKRMFSQLRKRLPSIKIKDYTKEEEA